MSSGPPAATVVALLILLSVLVLVTRVASRTFMLTGLSREATRPVRVPDSG